MKKGISIIVLIITIIVIIIIASSVIISLNRTNIIENANKAKIITYLNNFKDEFNLYVLDKKLENPEFNLITLNASKEGVMYNTKGDSKDNSIKNIIKSIDEKFLDKIEIVKGELVINTKDINEINAAKEVGIEPNPYDIKDGELQSSENNLLLMDETGTLTIPNSIKSIGNGAFRNLNGLKTIVIPGNVEKIGNHAFSGNDTLENVILEEGIKEIGNFAFEDCSNLKSIKMANSINKIGDTCFSRCNSLVTFNFPENLNYIPYRMFSSCSSLKEVTIPNQINRILGAAFEYCGNLENVIISPNTQKIDWGAFNGCYNLTNINLDGNNQFIFENGMVISKDRQKLYYLLLNKSEFTIPEGIKFIENGALSSNRNVERYYISKDVEEINTYFNYNVKEINVDIENKKYSSIDGNLYDKNQQNLIRYCKNDEEPKFSSNLKKIKNLAFSGQNNIKRMILPETLEKLEGWALSLGNVTEVYIGKNVNNLTTSVFIGLNDSANVTLSPENPYYNLVDGIYLLTKDSKKLIAIVKNLTEYNIPNTVNTLGSSCFYSKSKLKNIELLDNIEVIENYAFDVADRLEKVKISKNIKRIDKAAFNRCKSLKEVIIDKKENEISGSPWGAPYGLRAIKWKR